METHYLAEIVEHGASDVVIWRDTCEAFPIPATRIMEYRAAAWLDEHYPGWRDAAAKVNPDG